MKTWIDPVDGLSFEQQRAIAVVAKLDAKAIDGAADILTKRYPGYVEGDCDLAEINPLILTPDGPRAPARRQGEPRRQRGVPPSRVGRVRGDCRARRA